MIQIIIFATIESVYLFYIKLFWLIVSALTVII